MVLQQAYFLLEQHILLTCFGKLKYFYYYSVRMAMQKDFFYYSSFFNAVNKIYSSEGPRGFFSGIAVALSVILITDKKKILFRVLEFIKEVASYSLLYSKNGFLKFILRLLGINLLTFLLVEFVLFVHNFLRIHLI